MGETDSGIVYDTLSFVIIERSLVCSDRILMYNYKIITFYLQHESMLYPFSFVTFE